MLRVSSKVTGTDLDLQMVNGDADAAESSRGVEFALELMTFAESLASWDEAALLRDRQRLLEAAGPAVLVEAAAVAANFQRMVRIADATGIPYDDADDVFNGTISDELSLKRFESAENSMREKGTPPPIRNG